MSSFDSWVGRERSNSTQINTWPAQAMAALLDTQFDPHRGLPPLWHWLYFLEAAPHSKIGPDGHPVTGDFLPSVPNPRRMFAGARTTFLQPLRFDAQAELNETILAVEHKEGAQGPLYLVTVEYEYSQAAQICLREERDFIYLPAVTATDNLASVGHELQPVDPASWESDVETDPAMLMRFSALTYNAHRIHYDLEYARCVEMYPGLVVHGPLTAILLAELFRNHAEQEMHSFHFRAQAPLFCGQLLRLRGSSDSTGVKLDAWRPDGKRAVKAEVEYQKGTVK